MAHLNPVCQVWSGATLDLSQKRRLHKPYHAATSGAELCSREAQRPAAAQSRLGRRDWPGCDAHFSAMAMHQDERSAPPTTIIAQDYADGPLCRGSDGEVA